MPTKRKYKAGALPFHSLDQLEAWLESRKPVLLVWPKDSIAGAKPGHERKCLHFMWVKCMSYETVQRHLRRGMLFPAVPVDEAVSETVPEHGGYLNPMRDLCPSCHLILGSAWDQKFHRVRRECLNPGCPSKKK